MPGKGIVYHCHYYYNYLLESFNQQIIVTDTMQFARIQQNAKHSSPDWTIIIV